MMAFSVCLLVSSALAAPTCKSLTWGVDESVGVKLPPEIMNVKEPGSLVGGPGTGHGKVAYIYGGMGAYPTDSDDPLHPGQATTPQRANLSLHLEVLSKNLPNLIPNPDFSGLCVMDFERTRADWNSTSPIMRQWSLADAGNDTELAIVQYESAIRSFMEGTIDMVRKVRPGCQVGWLNYPRSSYPHPETSSWDAYCQLNPDECWGFNKPGDGPGTGYLGPGAEAQRAFNDKLAWLWDALDVITGVIYITAEGTTSVTDTAAYVNSHAAEAVRLLNASHVRGGRSKAAMSVIWFNYNDVVNGQKNPQLLSSADARSSLLEPLKAGTDGVLVWGHLGRNTSSNNSVPAYSQYMAEVVAPIVADVCNKYGCCTEFPWLCTDKLGSLLV